MASLIKLMRELFFLFFFLTGSWAFFGKRILAGFFHNLPLPQSHMVKMVKWSAPYHAWEVFHRKNIAPEKAPREMLIGVLEMNE